MGVEGMSYGFAGFPKEGLKFLGALKKNNNREWFQAHKQTYEEKVKAPMLGLIGEVNAALAEFAPDYVSDPAKAFYRIYRDTRFSPDKTPYKTHVAAIFMPRGLVKHASASLYFQVSPSEVGLAGGIYMPGPEQLLAERNYLAANHERLRLLLRDGRLRELMGELSGDELTRVPKGFAADHPAADLLRMKQWYMWTELEPGLAATPKLLGELTKRFRVMIPLVEFLNEAFKPRRAGRLV
jgi:uncharacterized protein (TIGR02453 family)